MAEEHGEASVITRRDGRVGRILLNRPKSLNALDLPMIDAIAAALTAWRDDASVHAVVIEGAGGRAFCAGGDIRAIRAHALAGEKEAIEAFFSREYALNLQIAEYPKPYVALIDGVCMGGGIGVSVHGGIRVATEAAMFAMPETAIALFPDIGATYILPRLPGQLGKTTALHIVAVVLAALEIRGQNRAHLRERRIDQGGPRLLGRTEPAVLQLPAATHGSRSPPHGPAASFDSARLRSITWRYTARRLAASSSEPPNERASSR